MKVIIRMVVMATLMFAILPNYTAAQHSKPLSFENFYKKDTTKVVKGYYSIYRVADKYYVEIPTKGFGRDVLISTQVIKGYSSFVSPVSGVVRFSKGANNMINMTRSMLTETSADTTDFCMMSAVRNSGLMPVSQTFPIVAYGHNEKSVIIDLTSELTSSSGLFAVSSYSSLSHPDPLRSGVESYRAIDHGVAFTAKRIQTDYQVNPNTKHGEDVISPFLLEMVIQEIPQHSVNLKSNHSAYGFNTFTVTEYDTKKYTAFKRDYIDRWTLDASEKDLKKQKRGEIIEPQTPICICIDPLTPAPFVDVIKAGVEAWTKVFLKAGWKNVFRFSNDEKDASLSYKNILVRWGNAMNDNSFSTIINPENGEILSARINIMDVKADELLNKYFIQCGDKDSRILKDLHSLELRKEVLKVQMEALMANVLGLKSNFAASTAFTPDNLRSDKWLDTYGTSASITSEFMFNYVAKPNDRIKIANLMPKISVYDCDAIAYAYGNSNIAPSVKGSYYADLDKNDPYAQNYLSTDIIEASSIGIQTLQNFYPQISNLVRQLPADQNRWETVSDIAGKSLSLYHAYLYQIANMVGGASKRKVIPGVNEIPVTYIPKIEQEKALNYLTANLFTAIPAWMNNDSLKMATAINVKDYMIFISRSVLGKLLSKEIISSLVNAENKLRNATFTCGELFNYFDHQIFRDFDANKKLTSYQISMQACLIEKLIAAVNANNITGGLTDEAVVLHSYFIKTANKIKLLSETHTDQTSRENYQLLLIKMNHEYFDK